MDGKKAFKAFNFSMLFVIILIALGLVLVIIFTKSSFVANIDEYGCDSSKGYAYSFAKNKCVLVYEEALNEEAKKPTFKSVFDALI